MKRGTDSLCRQGTSNKHQASDVDDTKPVQKNQKDKCLDAILIREFSFLEFSVGFYILLDSSPRSSVTTVPSTRGVDGCVYITSAKK